MTPQKYIHKIFKPKKIFIFLKNQKNIEIQNFEPKKISPSLRLCENNRVPPPPPPPTGQTSSRQKPTQSPWKENKINP